MAADEIEQLQLANVFDEAPLTTYRRDCGSASSPLGRSFICFGGAGDQKLPRTPPSRKPPFTE
jgi:hypothetical protein